VPPPTIEEVQQDITTYITMAISRSLITEYMTVMKSARHAVATLLVTQLSLLQFWISLLWLIVNVLRCHVALNYLVSTEVTAPIKIAYFRYVLSIRKQFAMDSQCSNWRKVGGGLDESSPNAKKIFCPLHCRTWLLAQCWAIYLDD